MATEFRIREKDLKKYPHFDGLVSAEKLLALVTNPGRVTTHAFFPFIEYAKTYQPFRRKGEKPAPKTRLIRYASRRDAAIFSYYRFLLAQRYEASLVAAGIETAPIAYRKLPSSEEPGKGKCNIDFARDAVEEILRQGNCVAVTLDISKYFECIDHGRLYRVWCKLLGVEKLPNDHLQVFRAITKYTVVNRETLYERLGFIGPVAAANGSLRRGYVIPFRSMPKQLCSMIDFRKCVMGGNPKLSSIAARNKNTFGIPQGAPLSDLLANLYLLEFDIEVAAYVRSLGGVYWRYSDDIILVLPGAESVGRAARKFVMDRLCLYGEELHIKESKTAIVGFRDLGGGNLTAEHVSGAQGRNGLEYLGFRFDGKNVFLRDPTVSNFYRKITKAARDQARHHVSRYNGKSADWLNKKFDYHAFEKKFGRVKDFESLWARRGWTFWTYARRASDLFGSRGQPILRQVSRYRGYIRHAVKVEIDRQIDRRAMT